jgi:acyl-CoA synthetase (AMP-forming)/AMP-acid ligase II
MDPEGGMRHPRILDAIREVARAAPDAVAVVDRDRAVGFGALDAMARRMAGWLERQGLRPGDRVGITLRDGLPHLVASLGLMRLGCDQVGLPSLDPPAMRAALAARAGLVAVIGDRAEDALDGPGLILPDHAAIAADGTLGDAHLPATGPDGTTVLITSSGTTGRPKIVRLSERALRLRALGRESAVARRHSPIPVEFAQARWAMLVTIAAGGSWVFPDPAAPPLPEFLRRHGVDAVTLSPPRAEALLRAGGRGAWPTRTVMHLAGAPVAGELRARLQAEVTRNLNVLYGATECAVCCIAGPEDHARHPDGIGRAWSATLAIRDENGADVPEGAQGVLHVLSAGIAEGYLDDPEAEAASFLPGGWYRTGDVVSRRADGHLLFHGRADDMMILGTINIFPAEIERAAEGFPGLAACAAFPLRAGTLGEVPVLAAVPAAPGALDPAALLAHCRARLGLRAPRKVVLVPALPCNGAGKVLRRELAALAGMGGAAP